jgi:hypothetical protein
VPAAGPPIKTSQDERSRPRRQEVIPVSDLNKRILELLNSSEEIGLIEYEWERIWWSDQPGP